MSERKPNPVAEALAKTAAGGAHPEAELLTALAEGALTSREREGLMAHLAGCAECREVLRVSADAAPAVAQMTAMPARRMAVPRVTPWLAAAAVLIIMSGIVVRQELRTRPQPTTARNVPPLADTVPGSAPAEKIAPVAPPAPAPKEAKKRPENRAKTPAVVAPRVMAEAAPPPPLTQANQFAAVENTVRSPTAPQAEAGSGLVSSNGRVAAARIAPAPAVQLAPLPAEQVHGVEMRAPQALKPSQVAAAPPSPATTTGFVSAGNPPSYTNEAEFALARPRWRIDAAGEPERAFGSGPWQRVPLMHVGRMHAVAVLGTEVWAGGENSELYRSGDRGATWAAVTLPAKGEGAHTITHIRMSATAAITVEAADGTTWTSEDGGATWK